MTQHAETTHDYRAEARELLRTASEIDAPMPIVALMLSGELDMPTMAAPPSTRHGSEASL